MNPKAEYYLGQKFEESLTVEKLFYTKKVREHINELLHSSYKNPETRIFKAKINEDLMLEFRLDPIFREKRLNGILIIIYDITEDWKIEQDKNRFISMVAHELKSPIAAIINYINVILSGMFDDKPEKVHEILERCKLRGQAMLELIQDLLYINRRDTGKIEKTIKRYDLKSILEEQLEFYRVRLPLNWCQTVVKSTQ